MSGVPAAAPVPPSPAQHRTQFIRGVRDSMAKALAQGLSENEASVSLSPQKSTAAARSITGRLKQLIDKSSSEPVLSSHPSSTSQASAQTTSLVQRSRKTMPVYPLRTVNSDGTPHVRGLASTNTGEQASVAAQTTRRQRSPRKTAQARGPAVPTNQVIMTRTSAATRVVQVPENQLVASPVSYIGPRSVAPHLSMSLNQGQLPQQLPGTIPRPAQVHYQQPSGPVAVQLGTPMRFRTIICQPLASPPAQGQVAIGNVNQHIPNIIAVNQDAFSNLRLPTAPNVRHSPALNAGHVSTPVTSNVRNANISSPLKPLLPKPHSHVASQQEMMKTVNTSVSATSLKSPTSGASLMASPNNQKPIVSLSDEPSTADTPNRENSHEEAEERKRMLALAQLKLLQRKAATIVVSPERMREVEAATAGNGHLESSGSSDTAQTGAKLPTADVEDASRCASGLLVRSNYLKSTLPANFAHEEMTAPVQFVPSGKMVKTHATGVLYPSDKGRPRIYPKIISPVKRSLRSRFTDAVFAPLSLVDAEEEAAQALAALKMGLPPPNLPEDRAGVDLPVVAPGEFPPSPVPPPILNATPAIAAEALPAEPDNGSPETSIPNSEVSTNSRSRKRQKVSPVKLESVADSVTSTSGRSSAIDSSPRAKKRKRKALELISLSQDEGVINMMSEMAARGDNKKRIRSTDKVDYKLNRRKRRSIPTEKRKAQLSIKKENSCAVKVKRSRGTPRNLSSPATKLKARALKLTKKVGSEKAKDKESFRSKVVKAKLMKSKSTVKRSSKTIVEKAKRKTALTKTSAKHEPTKNLARKKNESPIRKQPAAATPAPSGKEVKPSKSGSEQKPASLSPAGKKSASQSDIKQPKTSASRKLGQSKRSSSQDASGKSASEVDKSVKLSVDQNTAKPPPDVDKAPMPPSNQEKSAKPSIAKSRKAATSDQGVKGSNSVEKLSKPVTGAKKSAKPSSVQQKSTENRGSTPAEKLKRSVSLDKVSKPSADMKKPTRPCFVQEKPAANRGRPRKAFVPTNSAAAPLNKSPLSQPPVLYPMKLVTGGTSAVQSGQLKQTTDADRSVRYTVHLKTADGRTDTTADFLLQSAPAAAAASSATDVQPDSSDASDPVQEPSSPGSLSYGSLQRRLELATMKQAKRRVVPEDRERASSRSNLGTIRHREICVKKFERFHQVVLCPVTTRLKAGLNARVMRELREYLSACARDPTCRAVLLTSSAGPFCQGLDYSCLLGLSPEKRRRAAEELANELKEFVRAVAGFSKPLLAGVTGACVGLGVGLLPLCDLVFISEKATLQTFYTRLGTVPEGGATHSLTVLLGHMKASSLLMAGQAMTGCEAVQLNLATGLLWSASAYEELIARARDIISNVAQVQSLESTKALIRHSLRAKVELALRSECPLLVHQWSAPEFQQRARLLYDSGQLQMQKAALTQ